MFVFGHFFLQNANDFRFYLVILQPISKNSYFFMVRNIFKGLGIALITPFLEDGSVDYKSLIRLVEYQLDNGADFFCILATTGETPTLTQDEKQKIKDLIVDLVV